MKRWRVRLTPGDPGVVLEADRHEVVHGGALLLRNGHPFEPVLVRAYAPAAWHSIEPVTEESA